MIDADGALGIHVGPHAMRMAIAKAKAVLSKVPHLLGARRKPFHD